MSDAAPATARSPFDTLAAAVPMLRVAEREARLWRRFWRSSALTLVLMPLMFLGAIGLGLGGLVDENTGSVGGVDYLAFVAPGILAASAMQGAAGQSLWPVLGGMKWIRTFHGAAATPLRPGDVFGGWVLWIGAREAMNATIFIVTGLAFGAPLSAYSAVQDSDLGFPVIMRVGIVPLFLFSGTFFPVDQLPAWLQPVAWVSPLWHGVELCRGATTGSLGLASVGHVAYLGACIAVGCWFGVRNFASRLAP
jgi:lipooligosaccharide transport system permease protein